ncbi:MAG: hypothetical protein HON53_21615, partial [Planctomycetaceae bacterium]|nr:hypothetical protein [Planctomycetaceae bacterium]
MTERHETRYSADDERLEVPKPSLGSRVVSNLGTIIVTAIMVGGIWWWTVGMTEPKPEEPPKTAETNPIQDDSHSHSANGDNQTEPVVQPASTNGHPPADDLTPETTSDDAPDFDAARTSWQDPFFASHWKADGWNFQPDAMQSDETKPASARFRRDYRKITVECLIAPTGESGVFQIRLFAPTTDALMQAEFSREAVRISSTIKGKRTLIKQRRFPVPFVVEKPTKLRFTATGNRVLVICNGARVLNCSQP